MMARHVYQPTRPPLEVPPPQRGGPRAAVIARIDAWWKAFLENQQRLSDHFDLSNRFDMAGWMTEHLGPIDRRLAWEFGPGRRNPEGHRLMITPESEHQLRPLVEVLLSRAPALPGWEFYPYRLADEMPIASQWVKARTGMDVTGWSAHAESGVQGLVHVFASPPRGLFRSTEKDREATFVALECLLGEECLDSWIGAIEVDRRKEARPLAELPARVSALIGEAVGRLPATPCWQRAENTEWSLLELKPKEADDYPGQLDLLVGKTMDVEMWKAQHFPPGFRTCRFSRTGESFLYLKTDGSQGLPEDAFADKSEIEEAIDDVLAPRQLGCSVGGGTGLRYSYVDLAVTDVAAAVQALLPVLRAGKLPLRSWLLFFDAELADEWIPIWDEARPRRADCHRFATQLPRRFHRRIPGCPRRGGIFASRRCP